MRITKLFTKTVPFAPKDETAINAQLLIRAGYVHKEMAGVYAYLPLGLRVLENIKQIVREEMNSIGCQEIIMTALQKKELWQRTDRWDDTKVDVWFKSELKSGGEVGLGWSHEEPITDMMRSYIKSYRDLPVYAYQFQTKLRNELRAKSGIMRGREFVMKDLYSYSRTSEDHQRFYDSVIQAYLRVFDRVGLGDSTFLTFASGGAFTQFSHEFQTVTEAGEDVVYLDRKKKIAVNKEVISDDVLSQLGLNKETLEEVKTAEVGNIFNFGKTKSEQLGLFFNDEDGTQKPVILGSYGIGITRLMGVIVEKFSDEKGLVWPVSVAPFQVHLIGLDMRDSAIREKAEKTYEALKKHGISVLFDDREETQAGAKFSDADLMGMPVRLVVSKRTGGGIEVKDRIEKEASTMSIDDLLKRYAK